MKEDDLVKLQYPIGRFVVPGIINDSHIDTWISHLERFPGLLRSQVGELSDAQLDTAYRPGGWTVRQVVHHLSDSHHHSYTRVKWALTEDRPLIKAYCETDWAQLDDSRLAPIRMSLDYLAALHTKMVYLFRGLSETDLNRSFLHPEDGMPVKIVENIGRYAWHGRHHLAQIKGLAQREAW